MMRCSLWYYWKPGWIRITISLVGHWFQNESLFAECGLACETICEHDCMPNLERGGGYKHIEDSFDSGVLVEILILLRVHGCKVSREGRYDQEPMT